MAANVNNYVRAGNAAVRKNVKIRQALAENKPRYDKIAQASVQAAAKNKVNAASNNARTAKAKIEAEADMRRTKIGIDRDKKIRGYEKQARMTGMLAGGAALIGIGAMNMNKKDEPDEMLSVYQGLIDKNNSRLTDATSEITRLQNELDNFKIPDLKGGDSKKADAPETATVSGGEQTNTGAQQGDAWSKLSRVIRYGEGTLGDKGYTTQFTGSQFSDMSRHPRQIRSSGSLSSDAAGAYQFLSTTWDGAKKALGLQDFSPSSQEKAGRYLTQNRGVNPDQLFTTREEFKAAMDKLAPEWASLPYSGTSPQGYGQGSSYYGQGGKSLDELWEVYQGLR